MKGARCGRVKLRPRGRERMEEGRNKDYFVVKVESLTPGPCFKLEAFPLRLKQYNYSGVENWTLIVATVPLRV